MQHYERFGFLSKAEDPQGYPRWDYEMFYQQGLACFVWRLPRLLVRQAFRKACEVWKAKSGMVAMWQIRAFIYGVSGGCRGGIVKPRAPEGFCWPASPDPSWALVVCVYPDGYCDLDMVHPVSRRFWSEDNGFLALPSYDRTLLNLDWFETMGFEVMRMQPLLKVKMEPQGLSHLKIV